MNGSVWQAVRDELVSNAELASREHKDEIESWKPVLAGGRYPLPGYAPYIGEGYFDGSLQGLRILAYALSQNISEEAEFAEKWATNQDRGLDRQNIAWRECGLAAMHPFDTGHIPILASLLRRSIAGTVSAAEQCIYPGIAATNLSKFSFRTADRKRTTDVLQSLERSWEWFSRREVELLQPDYIVCCDPRVFRVVATGLKEPCMMAGRPAPKLILVSFPSTRVINRHYRKELQPDHAPVERMEPMVAALDLDHMVCRGDVVSMTLRERLHQDGYYFAEMLARMESQLANRL